MSRSPFPLQWPEGMSRTPPALRERSRFTVTVFEAVLDLKRELDLMGACNVVITCNLPTRQDGLPYSTASCDDPGVSVWFVHNGLERVFACDRWDKPAANLRSIGLTIQSLRGIERWGSAGMVTQAFSGFAVLPPTEQETHPQPATPRKRNWREVFRNVDSGIRPRIDIDRVGKRSHAYVRRLALAEVNARHRQAIRIAHPDAGGGDIIAAELNAARDEAEAELGGL